jgi:hypothetical protein
MRAGAKPPPIDRLDCTDDDSGINDAESNLSHYDSALGNAAASCGKNQ